MAGFYSGQDGELLINGTKAAKVRSWSFTVNVAVLETVSLEDTDRTIIPGIRSVTGNCSLYYYQTAAGVGNDVTTFINNMIKSSTAEVTRTEDGVDVTSGDSTTTPPATVKLQLRVNDGSNHGRYIELNTVLTSLSMTNSVGEVLSADVSFEGNGAPTGLAI